MSETLWISLPQQEITSLRAVINLIERNNLTSLTSNQLIEKLENEQAAAWIAALAQYNEISSVGNLDSSEMLHRTRSLKRKFSERGYQQLESQTFQPNELLALIILCYSNANLIGPRLCAALYANNRDDIKKEILENSAYVSSQRRVVPWASNLRLLTYALYANDTTVQLPTDVITRIREGAEARNIVLDEIGGQSRNTRSVDSQLMTNELPYDEAFSENYRISDIAHSIFELQNSYAYKVADHRFIDGTSSVVSNAAVASNSNATVVLLSGLVGFFALRSIPVIGPVVHNINRDLHAGVSRVAGFFSGRNTGSIDKDAAQPGQYLPAHSKLG